MRRFFCYVRRGSPNYFMYQSELSRSQFVTLKRGRNQVLTLCFYRKWMLCSPVRTFIELRELLATHEEVRQKIGNMEKKYDHHFKVVFEAVRALISQPEKKKGKIGFKREWAGG